MWEAFEPGSGRKSTRERLLCVISLQCNGRNRVDNITVWCFTLWWEWFSFRQSVSPGLAVHQPGCILHLQSKQCVMFGDTCKCSVSKKSLFLGARGAKVLAFGASGLCRRSNTVVCSVLCLHYIPSVRRIDCTSCVNCMPFYTWRHTLHSRKARPLHIFACFSLITKFRRWKEGNWIMPNWQLFET